MTTVSGQDNLTGINGVFAASAHQLVIFLCHKQMRIFGLAKLKSTKGQSD